MFLCAKPVTKNHKQQNLTSYILFPKIQNIWNLTFNLAFQIIYGKAGTATQIKKNLRKFNGFEFDKESDEYKKKIEETQKIEVAKLKQTAEILAIEEPGSTKEELTKSVIDFLCKPEGKTLAEEEEEKQQEEEEAEDEVCRNSH